MHTPAAKASVAVEEQEEGVHTEGTAKMEGPLLVVAAVVAALLGAGQAM
jgi:hypothetical protein